MIPPPDDAAKKAALLRAAMFDGIDGGDVSEVTRKVLEQAKAGDLAAAKLFFSLIGARG